MLSCPDTNGKGTWSTLYLFLGGHLLYFATGSEDNARLCLLCTAFLRFWWNSCILARPSSTESFFLFVLLLKEILYLFLSAYPQHECIAAGLLVTFPNQKLVVIPILDLFLQFHKCCLVQIQTAKALGRHCIYS